MAQPTHASTATPMNGGFDLSQIKPADYNLPSTHVVQALAGRYITAVILTTELEKAWPNNWQVVTRLDYHIVILPKALSPNAIHSLQKKSEKARKAARASTA